MTNSFFPRGARPQHQSDPSWKQVAITPGTSELADWPRTLRIGSVASGTTLVYVDSADNEITLLNCKAGEYVPAVMKKVLAESSDSPAVATTVSSLVGFI